MHPARDQCIYHVKPSHAAKSTETTTNILRLVLRRQGRFVRKPTKESWTTERQPEIHCLLFHRIRIVAACLHTGLEKDASQLNVIFLLGFGMSLEFRVSSIESWLLALEILNPGF